jgi:cytoskeletal protein CcmA (bactofilin family)
MFSKGKVKPNGRALVLADGDSQSSRHRAPSIITAELRIVGSVTTEGELHVDGRVDGDVTGQIVTIGARGYVSGRIEGVDILVQGAVNGFLRGHRVRLVQGSRVVADIEHDVLAIEEGAAFEGNCRRIALPPPEEDLVLSEVARPRS